MALKSVHIFPESILEPALFSRHYQLRIYVANGFIQKLTVTVIFTRPEGDTTPSASSFSLPPLLSEHFVLASNSSSVDWCFWPHIYAAHMGRRQYILVGRRAVGFTSDKFPRRVQLLILMLMMII